MSSDDEKSGLRPDDIQPGTWLGEDVELLRYLGRGAYGIVYEGRQHPIGRRVAVKVLGKHPRPAVRDRFLNEARAAAAIDHPNVVTIYDFGVHEGLHPYIVMELLQGHDLEFELSKGGGLDKDRALKLFADCLEALGDAHRLGIVHKDLKPSNLFLKYAGTRRESMMILDFGVSRVIADEDSESIDSDAALTMRPSGYTRPGYAAGTPRYMAPEYIEHQRVTPALDVYQMGLILCEALSGDPVVDGDSGLSAYVAHVQGDLRIPDVVRQDPDLWAVLRRSMARQPENRYADGAAFNQALLDVIALNASSGASPQASDQTAMGSPLVVFAPTEEAPVERVASLGTAPTLDEGAATPVKRSPKPQAGRARWWLGGALAMFMMMAVVGSLSLGALALGWQLWPGGGAESGQASQRDSPSKKTPSKRTSSDSKRKKSSSKRSSDVKAPRHSKVPVRKLTKKLIKKRLRAGGWAIWREDNPENLDGFVIVATGADHVGASLIWQKVVSEDMARLSADSLKSVKGAVTEVDGRWLLTVTVYENKALAESILELVVGR